MPEITGAPGGTPRCLQLSANMQPMIKIVEGVIVEQGSVISMGVFIGRSRTFALLLTQPTLVKRPLLERGTLIAVGYSAASYEALLRAH